ncbi:DUF4198 domain-containing protein [Pseudothauera nasutitermitis]|uniref:DUF4198 domain-containing protein n=1 Tax=Pseudothauera nasutitermitis TaxID=2565930 RepID=A0A4S4AT36_9RHOO|nr:DUF4198 domain-containing protein [Pseudothauera nasutitermitis]THF63053.1 DUF4198 domain-containing protein [Pseudothauera nasutitermitis]
MHCFAVPRAVSQLLLCGALVLGAAVARADYVWLSPGEAGTAVAEAGLLDGERVPMAGFGEVDVSQGGEARTALAADGDRLLVSGLQGDGDLRLVGHRATAEGALMYYQAKLGRQETRASLDLELVPTEPGGNTFRLMWKGNPVSASQVNVTTSEGWSRVLRPAKDGTVTLSTPFPGLYVLELTAKVNGSATVDGKKYDDVRHTTTLSFVVQP